MENFNIFAIINLKMKNQEALTEKKQYFGVTCKLYNKCLNYVLLIHFLIIYI